MSPNKLGEIRRILRRPNLTLMQLTDAHIIMHLKMRVCRVHPTITPHGANLLSPLHQTTLFHQD